MIFLDVDMARRGLPERADPKDHAVFLPSFLVHVQHRHAGGRARQSPLEAAGRFYASQPMRNGNHERCRHFNYPDPDPSACNPRWFEKKAAPICPILKVEPENGTL